MPVPSRRQGILREDRIQVPFFKINPVADREALSLHFMPGTFGISFTAHACIHEKQLSVRHFHCAAGKAAVLIIVAIRCQRGRQVFPVQQVIAHRMSPVHGIPGRAVRVILIEQLVSVLIINESVRVIHPAGSRTKMKTGTL